MIGTQPQLFYWYLQTHVSTLWEMIQLNMLPGIFYIPLFSSIQNFPCSYLDTSRMAWASKQRENFQWMTSSITKMTQHSALARLMSGQGEWRCLSCRKKPVKLTDLHSVVSFDWGWKTLIPREALLHTPQCLLIYIGAFSHLFHHGTGAPSLWKQAEKIGTVHLEKRKLWGGGDLLQYLAGKPERNSCQELY